MRILLTSGTLPKVTEITISFPAQHPRPFGRLRAYGVKFLQRAGLKAFTPLARRALAVTEPAQTLQIQINAHSPVSLSGNTLTILSANLYHDWPFFRRGEQRLEALANVAEEAGADVLLLQEVWRKGIFKADRWLAERLGFSRLYARSNGHQAIGFEEGLGILSRFPLANPNLQQLGKGSSPFWRRIALSAEVKTPIGALVLVNTHLSLLGGENTRQTAALQTWVERIAGDKSALIGGDFNAHEKTTAIQNLSKVWKDLYRRQNASMDGSTHHVHLPGGLTLRSRRLDYIFLHGGKDTWETQEACVLDNTTPRISDHQPVLVRLKSKTS